MKRIFLKKKKVNSYRDAKDATSAHEKILADPTLPGTIGNFRSKRIFFRDALHLAHPARSSTFFSEKRAKNVTSRWYNPLQNSSGMKFPSSPYINFKKKYSYEDKVRYEKSGKIHPSTVLGVPS